jgi:hypothetical protein
MIQLNRDSLIFQTAEGEQIPCSAEVVTIELIGEAAKQLDPDLIRNASAAVLHFFKEELKRDFVSVNEFSLALERVLRGFGVSISSSESTPPTPVFEADLGQIASSSGKGCELFFFLSLREELQKQEARSVQIVRFKGLRRSVKQLIGARRWTVRCQSLSDDIVEFLRHRFKGEGTPAHRSLIIV